jgi:lysophospholipase L1-like esterase
MPIAADTLAKLSLAPLLIAQALYVRQKALNLPEPPGPRQGHTGTGRALRLLITGDSSGAGVGATAQARALSGCLVDALASDHQVTWQLEARTGDTTRATLARLPALPAAPFDVAVLALGVNDVTKAAPLPRWSADQRKLHQLLRQKFGVRHILASGIPPIGQFPLLPQPLRGLLGRTADRFDAELARLAHNDPSLHHLPFDLPFRPEYIARDGFHPSEMAYPIWAARLAAEIRRLDLG